MPGRNDPCPCGSGKKYKRCCYDADQRIKAPLHAAPAPLVSTADAQPVLRRPTPPDPREPIWVFEDDGLDELSNSVLDLVTARRFDEALAACKRLLEEFPDVHDGLERSAIVYAAMGDHARAADFYRKTVDFVSHPDRIDDYETLDIYQAELEKQERLAGLR